MERRNAWLSYKEAEETEMEKLAKAYREFLDKGKTERECVAEIVKEAEAAGYESLESKLEKGEKIKAGDKVYAVGMKKIVALFHVGTEELSGGMCTYRFSATGCQAESSVRGYGSGLSGYPLLWWCKEIPVGDTASCHAWCCCKEGRKHCGDQHW